MRRALLSLASCVVLFAAAARAEQVVLKDGSVITTAKPHVIKGNQAILTLPDGTLVSVPANQVDGAKTAAANAVRVRKGPSSAITLPPQSPGEAAKMKGGRKATIVLSDEDVQHPIEGMSAGEGAPAGDGKVEVTNVITSREGGLVMISGSLQNSGDGDVSAVAVTVEAVGESNKTVNTSFGRVAKDALAPGEKTTFTAEFQDNGGITNFRFVPRWQVKIPVNRASEAGGAPAGAASGEQAPPPAATPAPAPAPKPEVKYVPRGDQAPPPANAPPGSLTNPNTGATAQPVDLAATPPPSGR